eukprot:2154856-Alexandrium_andersonii.AAC.1
MSASLVGSEMCIRDSPRLAGPRLRSAPLPRTRGSDLPRPSSQRDPRGPVSYTHLTLPTICSV